MRVFLMIAILLTNEGGHIMAKPYESLAACEAAKADTTAEAIKAGLVDFGLKCVEVEVGKAS